MTKEDEMRMFNSKQVLMHIIESGQMTPLEVIEAALPYLRNPTEPDKADKIRIMEMIGAL